MIFQPYHGVTTMNMSHITTKTHAVNESMLRYESGAAGEKVVNFILRLHSRHSDCNWLMVPATVPVGS